MKSRAAPFRQTKTPALIFSPIVIAIPQAQMFRMHDAGDSSNRSTRTARRQASLRKATDAGA
jgi:predicted ATPase